MRTQLKPTEAKIVEFFANNVEDGVYISAKDISTIQQIDRGNLARYIQSLEQKNLVRVKKVKGKVFVCLNLQTNKTQSLSEKQTNKQTKIQKFDTRDQEIQDLKNDKQILLEQLKKADEEKEKLKEELLKYELEEAEEHLEKMSEDQTTGLRPDQIGFPPVEETSIEEEELNGIIKLKKIKERKLATSRSLAKTKEDMDRLTKGLKPLPRNT